MHDNNAQDSQEGAATTRGDHGQADDAAAKARALEAARARELEAQLDALPVATAHEYREARKELAVLGLAFAELAKAQTESDVAAFSKAIAGRVRGVGLRWLRARRAVTNVVAGGATGEINSGAVALCVCGHREDEHEVDPDLADANDPPYPCKWIGCSCSNLDTERRIIA